MAGSGAVFGVKTVRARGQECFAIEMTREFVKGRRYTHRVGAATEGNRDQSRHLKSAISGMWSLNRRVSGLSITVHDSSRSSRFLLANRWSSWKG